jgi:hypothetical protein
MALRAAKGDEDARMLGRLFTCGRLSIGLAHYPEIDDLARVFDRAGQGPGSDH